MGGRNGGRKKLPLSEKMMKGTVKKIRETGLVAPVHVPDYVPDPPPEFSDSCKKMYYQVTNELRAKGILDVSDLQNVIALCSTFESWLEHEQMDKIETVTDMQGNTTTKVSAAHKIAIQQLTLFIKLSSEFGFTPIARERLKMQVINTNPNDDYFT